MFLPRCESGFKQKSKAFSGAKLWNKIPVNIERRHHQTHLKGNLKHITGRFKKRFEIFAFSEHSSTLLNEKNIYKKNNIICFKFHIILFSFVFISVAVRIIVFFLFRFIYLFF